MPIQKLTTGSNFAVEELHNVLAVRTGDLVSQYRLNAGVPLLENGMLVLADHFARDIKLPTAITNKELYLHASAVKDYEGRGRATFAVRQGEAHPRLYRLTKGDTFSTNAVAYDDAVYANPAAIKAAITGSAVFGIPDTSGRIRIVATVGGTEVVVLKALDVVTLPSGEVGIKFVVIEGTK